MLFPFQQRLSHVLFEGLAYIHAETFFAAGKLSAYGRLKFVQDQLLNYKGRMFDYQVSLLLKFNYKYM